MGSGVAGDLWRDGGCGVWVVRWLQWVERVRRERFGSGVPPLPPCFHFSVVNLFGMSKMWVKACFHSVHSKGVTGKIFIRWGLAVSSCHGAGVLGVYFNYREWDGVIMPGFWNYYLVWFVGVGGDFGWKGA